MNGDLDKIKAIILDMDGVIWRSFTPIGNIPWVFDRLRELEIKFALVTNNSSKTRSQYRQKIQEIHTEVDECQIFTSSLAMARILTKKFPKGGPVFILGEEGLRQPLAERGFYHQEQDVLAVVCGLDREFSWDKLTKITYLIRSGVDFYMTNPDRTFPTTRGLGPGAGAIQAAIEAATDVTPIMAGKPSPIILYTVLESFFVKPENALVVGDRLETDIQAGQAAGCQTAVVLSGVATRSDAEKWHPMVDFISEDLEHLIRDIF